MFFLQIGINSLYLDNKSIEKGVFSFCFMINYVVISTVKHIPMMPVENSLILAGVPSILAFKRLAAL